MQTSRKGLDIIETSEDFIPHPYMPTPNDVPTIGYGTTIYPTGAPVKLTDLPITRVQAEEYLKFDVRKVEQALERLVKVPLTQNQFDALVSFVYNVGIGNFGGSTLLKLLNQRNYRAAAEQFPRWNKQKGKVLGGLVTRRAKERLLFLS